MNDDAVTSPFHTRDIQEPHSDYWVGRRKVAAAMRELIEATTTSDLREEEAALMAEDLLKLAAEFREKPQLRGVIAHGKAHGSLPVANHEILCVGGESHPISPGLKHWSDGDRVRGSVEFNWSYEGPPGHVHGGWVAAILDHFMGMAHMRSGKPGMTGSLDIRYLRPTPLNRKIDLVAEFASLDARKTQVTAEMQVDDTTTASAVAVFVKPRSKIFTEGR